MTSPACCERTTSPSCGCASSAVEAAPPASGPWVDGVVPTAVGDVPRVRTELAWADRLGAWKARWAIGRMSYRVEPGLYAVGAPTPASPVLVSANYKMSFDRLRAELGGRDAWVLVADTQGINVWCAAGKGTFSAEGIARQVAGSGLAEVVTHRVLILPQLSAPGVDAREVRRLTGFRAVFGPVRAEDLPAFLDAGMRAAADMRRVRFGLVDRLVVVPVELVLGAKKALFVAFCLLVLGGLGPGGYSWARLGTVGLASGLLFLAAYLVGVSLPPMLLPWLPGRAFATKGAFVGLAFGLAVSLYAWASPTPLLGLLNATSWLLLAPALASFLAMNFTGASTYTSLSGVKRETKAAVPVQVAAAVLGLVLWIVGLFV